MNTYKLLQHLYRIMLGLCLSLILLPTIRGQNTGVSTFFATTASCTPTALEIFEGESFLVSGNLLSNVDVGYSGKPPVYTYRAYLTEGSAEIPIPLSFILNQESNGFGGLGVPRFSVSVPGFLLNRHGVDRVNLTLKIKRDNTVLTGGCSVTVWIRPAVSNIRVSISGTPVTGGTINMSYAKPAWAKRTALLKDGAEIAAGYALTLSPLKLTDSGAYAARIYFGPLGHFVDGPTSTLLVRTGTSTNNGTGGGGIAVGGTTQTQFILSITERGVDNPVKAGKTARLIATLAPGVSTQTHTIVWEFNGQIVARGTAELVIPSVKLSQDGWYFLRVTRRSDNRADVQKARLKVYP